MQRVMLLDLTSGRLRPMRRNPPLWTSAGKGWDGFQVEEFAPADSTSTNVALVESTVYMPVDGRIQLEWHSERETVAKIIEPGQISILPANHPYSVRLRTAAGSVVVSLSDHLLTLAAAEQGEFGAIQPVWVHGVEDRLLRELVMTLREEMRVAQSTGRRYAQSLAAAVAAHVVCRYSGDRLSIPARPCGLSMRALRQVVQFIHDHLDEELTLVRLAEQARLSTCHFARMFKNSTGLSPHRYVLNCRIARAKKLLLQGARGLADVALAAGFCDQGHMTRAFREIVGITPAVFAREANPF